MLPPIPAKRYFTIGEVSELCGVKPYVLRYWEQEFTQLKPMKRRGNRRYYQHHEVLLSRRIRELLYDQGFTISGARNRLSDAANSRAQAVKVKVEAGTGIEIATMIGAGFHDGLALGPIEGLVAGLMESVKAAELAVVNESSREASFPASSVADRAALSLPEIRAELLSIRRLLSP